MKLYYYKATKTFHCYTECSDTFNIFDLLVRYYEVRHIEYNWYNDVLGLIENKRGYKLISFDDEYVSVSSKYQLNSKIVELPEYPKDILKVFKNYYCQEWLNEDITVEVMRQYNILYSWPQNSIVIPHYDIKGRLVGIRKRVLNSWEENEGKYKPIIIENKIYSHPLSLNLYGLYNNLSSIKERQQVILVEGEKSVLKAAAYYKNSNVVAVCGSNFNKMQLNLLLYNTNIREIVIAFDKEYHNSNNKEIDIYFSKLYNLCLKYNKYYNFSFVFDKSNLLDYKDSPLDKGKDVFEELMSKRIVVK